MKKILTPSAIALFAFALTACGGNSQNDTAKNAENKDHANHQVELLNVSYDVARDFYKDYNPIFVKHYQSINPDIKVNIKQSHGGSSKQALSVKNGLEADIVTMNQSSDIELLADSQLVDSQWRQNFPNNAIPFTSTIVFVVREGNPKGIKDWADLVNKDVQIIIANPKTTGNGRYAFLGAYGYGLHTFNQDKQKTHEFITNLLANVKVFENGGRAATTTFAQRQLGDVLITFENEANIIKEKFQGTQIVYPSYTVNAENPIAVVDTIASKKGTTDIAKSYLNHLYSNEGQELAVKYFLRPSNPDILDKYKDRFPQIQTFFPNDVFGDWKSIMQTYFKEGGVYDKLAVSATGEVVSK